MAAAGKYTAAICAAPRVLARAGLLDGKRATSYPGALDTTTVPGLDYREQAVITDGKVVTSRGPGTAMDFALQLIELLAGKTQRETVEAGLPASRRRKPVWPGSVADPGHERRRRPGLA